MQPRVHMSINPYVPMAMHVHDVDIFDINPLS